jgi:hypothetical protein
MPNRIPKKIARKRGRAAAQKIAADNLYDRGKDKRSANLMKRSDKNMRRADKLQYDNNLANRGNTSYGDPYDKGLNQPYGQDEKGFFYKKNPNDAWHNPRITPSPPVSFKKGGTVTKAKGLRNPKGSRRTL